LFCIRVLSFYSSSFSSLLYASLISDGEWP
jgi:hypothetical protein